MRRLFLTLALATLSAPSFSQTPPVPAAAVAASLDWMVGEWAGEGTFFGRPSVVSLSVRPILGGKAFALDYAMSVKAEGGKPAVSFLGHGFYRTGKDKRWDGSWIDNFGQLHELNGQIDGMSLVTVWGNPRTEIGRTRYTMEGGAMVLTDQALRATGAMEVFATSRLSKK